MKTTRGLAFVVGAVFAASSLGVTACGVPPPEQRSAVVERIIHTTTGSDARALTGSTRIGSIQAQPATAAGRRVDTLVQSKGKNVSLFAVLGKGQSQIRFPDLLTAGERLAQIANGQGLVIVNAHGMVTGVVAAPWAKDATGKSLPTSYAVDGSDIVQTVDTSAAAFPVVADPTIKTGTYAGVIPVYYVQFTWTETNKIHNNLAAGQRVAHAVCALIPVTPVAVVCEIFVAIFAQDLRNNVNAAIAEKKCLKLRVPASPFAAALAYDAYRVKCTS